MNNQKKSLVVLTRKTRSFLSLLRTRSCRYSLIFLVSLLFLSDSVGAKTALTGLEVAQQQSTTQKDAIRAQAQKANNEAYTLYKQGTAQSLRQAIVKWEEALVLWRRVGDKKQQAITLNKIGFVYDALGDKQQALKFYNSSLPLTIEVGDKAGQATILNNIGAVYNALGDNKQALKFYNSSLLLLIEVGNKVGQARTLSNIGLVYNALGDNQQALKFYNSSLPLSIEVGDKKQQATTLNNIGFVYNDLGDKQQALKFYNSSLPLLIEVGNKAEQGRTLNNIGIVYSALGNKQEALKSYNSSLPLSIEVGDKKQQARTLNNIGLVYNDLGDNQQALKFYNSSLPLLIEVGDKAGQATTLNNIGLVYDALGDKQQALKFYNSSLPLTIEVEDKAGQAKTLLNVANLERSRGNLEESLKQIQAAVQIIENLRKTYTNKELQSTYFATVQDYYKFYIDLLMQLHKKDPSKGYNAQALHISERARARSLLELLAEANVDIRQGVDPKLVAQERSLQQQLDAAEFQKTKMLEDKNGFNNKKLDKIKQQIESLDFQVKDVQAQILVKSPEYAILILSKFDKLVLTVPQIQQQVLDDNTLLLEYSLGKDRSFLWVVSKTSITSHELPKGADIEAAAEAFNKELLKTDSAGIPEVGIKLSQMILAPVASQLGQKRLLFVGDGALQTIPFTVLPIPQGSQNSAVNSKANSPTPLLVQNEILTLPSASSIAVLRNKFKGRPLAPKTIALFADPVFSSDDERLTKIPQPRSDQSRERSGLDIQIDECLNLNRLNYTKDEAKDILSLEPNPAKSFSALGFAASLTTAVKPDLSQYQIVHFATHGCVSQKNPQLTKLVLSQFDEKRQTIDGNLNLNKIYNLNLPVELVTLSACKTGLGQNVQGEGLVGLTRGFMYAGAKRVVVSLWSVNDLSTATLMKNFYEKMLKGKQNPVAAMREAQLEMWDSGKGKAPYYWAAFTVQGEWQ
ncbi:MAG: CHAT domain-containing protein [Tolypothrix brevis GSE-NOS-MK-07-07A]|jgi:CHAT domain-containing protein|nr:CHAT domain-containing protein [Tolypothrix brevis GSE-NOS-MK-07-07A]